MNEENVEEPTGDFGNIEGSDRMRLGRMTLIMWLVLFVLSVIVGFAIENRPVWIMILFSVVLSFASMFVGVMISAEAFSMEMNALKAKNIILQNSQEVNIRRHVRDAMDRVKEDGDRFMSGVYEALAGKIRCRLKETTHLEDTDEIIKIVEEEIKKI